MVKLVSIATSCLVLFQSFNICIGDIINLDGLIEHAQFHSEEYGDGFFIFISKHYGELKSEHTKKHQEEEKDHEELPFQQQTNTTVLSEFVLNEVLDTSDLEFMVHRATNYFYQDSYSSFEEDGPFQPPRQA